MTPISNRIELQEKHHQIFIEQAPAAIAMLDRNMVYLAVSNRWLKDFSLEGEQLIGRTHYNVFPEIGDDWKKKNEKCLNDAIDICDETTFHRKDGSIQWIFWNVQPWYNAEGEIGGLLIHAGDITEQKEKELKEKKFETILSDTSEIARIGTWEIDLLKEKVTWSTMVYEIHEVPLEFEPTVDSGLAFFEDEVSRNKIVKALKAAQEIGTPVNLNLKLKTAKGNYRWVKVVGNIERINGISTKIFGITQDITSSKNSEQLLNVANAELEAIFNSDVIAVITTNSKGIVNRFNKGAEKLLGYTADEIVGLEKPDLYLLKEERDKFKNDITKLFNGNSTLIDSKYNYRNENINDTRQWTFRRKDGSLFSTLTSITAINNNDGVNDGFISIITDISKIKEIKNELRKKNDLLNFAERLSLLGHWQWDTVLDKLKWSQNLYTIFELDENVTEFKFDTYFSFVHTDDKDLVTEYFEKSASDKIFYNFTHKIITTHGIEKTIHLIGKVITNEKGEMVEMFGTCQDVTESKMVERQLQKALSELQAIFNSKSVAIITSGRDGIINNFNSGAEALLGYSAAEIIGIHNGFLFLAEEVIVAHEIEIAQLFGEKIPRSDHYEAVSKYIDLSKEEVHDTREWTHRRKDGSTFLGQVTISSIKNIDGKHIGFMAMLLDISEIKNTELELLKKNQLLTYAEQISKMANWQWNPFTDEGKSSKNLYNILELDENITDLKLDIYLDFVHPEDKEITAQHFEKAVIDKKWESFTHRIITTSGIVKTIQLLGEVLTNEKDEIIEISGTCQDVTEIKMAERNLQKALSELQAIFNSESILIISTDKDGIINRFNHGAEVLLGYSAAEMVGIEKPRKYAHKDEIKKFKHDIARLNGKDPSVYDHYRNLSKEDLNDTREWTYYKKDGSPVSVLSTITTIKNSDNANEGFIAISKDISEIKNTELELLKKNQLLNFAEQISMMSNWKWDTVADKVEWSQNFYKILELDEAIIELKFNSYFRFVHPEDIEIVNRHFEKVERNKKWESLTHRIITTSGKVKTILILGRVFTNEKDEIVEMIGTCQDITEIKMAEKKFRGLLESAPDAMVIVNEKGRIQLINKQSEKLFGYAPEELFNKKVEVLIPARFTLKHSSYREGFFHTPKTRLMGDDKDLFALTKKGEEIPIQISLSPLHTEEGLLVSAAIRDISKQKIAEQKIIDAKESLEIVAQKLSHQNKQLADFTHITSHNLRAPVANLNSLMEIYKLTEDETERLDVFNKFDTVIDRLTLTLNTLIEALKTKISDSKEELEKVDLNKVLENTTQILSGAILKFGAVIESDFSQYSDVTYNSIYMESIFLNLIGNAIKYKAENRLPHILITAKIENGKNILTFKDNGLGIDLERHGHKLFGLNKVFHRHPDAKGVGLFLTKTQIEAMGGTITATSEVNVGTTFKINFN
ncbi:PAS domain S-box protein [Maribacter sp. Asnod1-A12]|uniref:PAS domain-containing sensor histidine kinase n=1 Tax=Maribacter sp. Asnod1-A12 TaxID=3160576 RepID=UPI0038651D94